MPFPVTTKFLEKKKKEEETLLLLAKYFGVPGVKRTKVERLKPDLENMIFKPDAYQNFEKMMKIALPRKTDLDEAFISLIKMKHSINNL